MRITICHRRWLKKRVDTSKTPLQLPSSENMAALCIIISFLLFHTLVWAGESCNKSNSENGFALVDHVYRSFFADRLVSCYMSCSISTSLSKFKLQSCWQELRIQQRHQILSTKVFCGETNIRLRGQPQLRCVSVSFLFSFIFFQIVSENHPFFFLDFGLFSSFFLLLFNR